MKRVNRAGTERTGESPNHIIIIGELCAVFTHFRRKSVLAIGEFTRRMRHKNPVGEAAGEDEKSRPNRCNTALWPNFWPISPSARQAIVNGTKCGSL